MKSVLICLAWVAGMLQPLRAQVYPYVPDASTLCLFHFDEASGSMTTNVGSLGGNAYSVNASTASNTPTAVTGMLGAVSYTNFAYGAAFATGDLIGFDYNRNGHYDGDVSTTVLSADRLPMSVLNMGNGGQTSWTIEAMICPAVINSGNQELICTDSSANNRGFQFRINTAAQLELNLIALGADITTPVPVIATDPVNGFVANNWYHVAATYDGTNVVLYWTLVSPSTSTAHSISTNAVAVGAAFGSVQGSLGIGNRTRGAASETFQGLIDEVRLSSVCRAANQMIFSPGTSLSATATAITPPNPVYAGTMVTLSATGYGSSPISYFWQSDGGTGGGAWTNLAGSATNTYNLATSGMPTGTTEYRLVITNSAGAFTNAPATLDLLAASGPVLTGGTTIMPAIVFAGNTASLSATFTGTQPLYYQWAFTNGSAVVLIPGATNNLYTLASAQTNNTGSYFLIASNHPPGLGGQIAASKPATLTVLPASSPASGMRCEWLEHPEETVITAVAPQFGWNYVPSFRNDFQTGYRLIVSSSQALASAGTGNMWDSGMVNSSNSLNVVYGGSALQTNASYYWRVQTLNSLGQAGAFSAMQQFNTASQLFDPLTTGGVVYQQPGAGSANCYPLRYAPVAPVLVTTNSLGHWFVDFGNDAFGYATLNLNGSFSGTTVNFELGELASGNVVNTNPGATIRCQLGTVPLQNGSQTYPLRSSYSGSWAISPPAATYGIVAPFRYLELSGLPSGITLTTNNVTQQRLETEFDDQAARFNSSSAALNQVWALCQYSMKALTFDGIYVDGDRERTPYEADSYIHLLSSYGVNNDFTLPRCTFEYLTNHLTWPTEWPMHLVFAAWADYQQTGDPYLLTKYYGFLTNKCMLLRNAGPDGLVKSSPQTGNTASGDIIDWSRISGDGIGNIDGYVAGYTNAVINAFYYRCLTIMTTVAQLTGHAADAANFAARANQVYSNYNGTFWSAASYLDSEGANHASADANFFPLAFGLVPASNQTAIVNYIHSRIAALGAMPAGVYGAQYLLEGLFLAGDADTALGLMTTNNTRSWMNMINLGSTITDEAWSVTDKANEDWNHAWGAAPGNLIPRYVLGLRPLAAGYGQILIQPQLGQSLSFVQGTVPTIRGPVSISVSNAPGQYQLWATIPGNVTASIMLPAAGATNPVALVDGEIIPGTVSNNWLTVTNVGSGQHAIWLDPSNTVSTATLYNNWAASWFGTNGSNPAIAGQTADPDGDGVDNFNEFIAGTNPLDATDRFQIHQSNYTPLGPQVTVTVLGHVGRHYTLQQAAALQPATWVNAGPPQTATNENQSITFTNSSLSGATEAFLRVLVTYP